MNEAQKKERSEYLEKNLEITECSQKKPYVFISYAGDNWEKVFKTAVVPMQKQYGLRVYADKAFDKALNKWIVPMLRNIRGADVVVAFISQSYIESYSCFLELLTAVNNKKQIVFVSLEEQLHLGDTTDLPVMEKGVKKEILNQGADIAINTNNTSNDVIRAMKSAYTSILTLLEQDALSKYDISDAFINFFRDAAVNWKTVNDLRAVIRTIGSVSQNVFDQSLVSETGYMAESSGSVRKPESVPVDQLEEKAIQEIGSATSVQQDAPWIQSAPVQEPDQQPAFPSVQRPNPQGFQDVRQPEWPGSGKRKEGFAGKLRHFRRQSSRFKASVIGGAAFLVIIIVVVALGGSLRNVTDRVYEASDGTTGTYTGEWRDNKPNGQGRMEWEYGDVYEGEWKDGVRDGWGTCTWATGSVYEGEWKDDRQNGQGRFILPDGSIILEGEFKDDEINGQGRLIVVDAYVFEGEFKDGKIDSYGKVIYENGDVFEGEFKDNMRNGHGKLIYENGDVFEGEYKDDKENGEGTYTDADGNVKTGIWEDGELVTEKVTDRDYTTSDGKSGTYTGEWQNDKPNGHGTYTDGDGNVTTGLWVDGKPVVENVTDMVYKMSDGSIGTYAGEWQNDRPNGQGRMKFVNGDVYEGQWKDGKMNGQGRFIGVNGDVYSGELKDDEINGQGTFILVNGDVYVGEFKDGQRNGYGTYKWLNGDVYEGEFKDDQQNGQGRFALSDGDVYEGEWKDGKINGEITHTDADGNVTVEIWENGEKVQ